MNRTKINPRLLYLQMEKETVPCPLCGSADHRQVFGNDRHGMGLSTVLCAVCGFVFTNPRPTQSEMNRFYKETYRHFYTGNPSPGTEYHDKLNVQKRLWFFNRVRSELANCGPSPAILDIGCGSGVLLHVFRTEIPQSRLYGVEPYAFYADCAARKNDAEVFAGDLDRFLEERGKLAGTFDLITLYHVLEHLYHPVKKLQQLRKFLKPSGLLLTQTPNLNSPHWQNAAQLCHIAHISQFDPATLKMALELSDFEILKSFAGAHPGNPRAITALGRNHEGIPFRKLAPPLSPREIRSRIHRFQYAIRQTRQLKTFHQAWADHLTRFKKLHIFYKEHGARPTVKRAGKLALQLLKKIYEAGAVPARKAYWRRRSLPAFRRILEGQTVLIIGSGPSARNLDRVPDHVKILTCNAGLRLFLQKKIQRRADIFLCRRKAMEEDYADIEDLLAKIKTDLFVMDDPEFIKKNPKLNGAYSELVMDHQKDNFYLEKLVRPDPLDLQRADNVWWTSAGVRLLQYALYFRAREIYLIGVDLNHSGYFWGEKDRYLHSGAVIRHKHSIDHDFLKIVSKKYPHVYSLSPESQITRYIPHRSLEANTENKCFLSV